MEEYPPWKRCHPQGSKVAHWEWENSLDLQTQVAASKEPWFDVVYGSGLNGRGHSGCSDRHRHKIVEYCHVGRTLHPTGR